MVATAVEAVSPKLSAVSPSGRRKLAPRAAAAAAAASTAVQEATGALKQRSAATAAAAALVRSSRALAPRAERWAA